MARPNSLLARALMPAACLAVIGYFGYHAVASDTGLLAWGGYRAERVSLERQAATIVAGKRALEHRVALLDPAHVDPDLADELVRENLAVVRPDEVVMPLPQGD